MFFDNSSIIESYWNDWFFWLRRWALVYFMYSFSNPKKRADRAVRREPDQRLLNLTISAIDTMLPTSVGGNYFEIEYLKVSSVVWEVLPDFDTVVYLWSVESSVILLILGWLKIILVLFWCLAKGIVNENVDRRTVEKEQQKRVST